MSQTVGRESATKRRRPRRIKCNSFRTHWPVLARGLSIHFATAAAPVCGGGDAFLAMHLHQLKDKPIWAFHGESDPIVPVARTHEMVGALNAIKNPNVKETTYPGVGHNSWEKAYADRELYTWLLAQHRKPPTTQSK